MTKYEKLGVKKILDHLILFSQAELREQLRVVK